MDKRIVKVVIECGKDGGFSAFSDDVPGVYANGASEEDVRSEFLSMMEQQADYMEQRNGVVPDFKGADAEFTYSLSALFQAYPFLNASVFAEWIGINPSLMRKYKAGISVPRGKNRELIQQGLRRVVEQLEKVTV